MLGSSPGQLRLRQWLPVSDALTTRPNLSEIQNVTFLTIQKLQNHTAEEYGTRNIGTGTGTEHNLPNKIQNIWGVVMNEIEQIENYKTIPLRNNILVTYLYMYLYTSSPAAKRSYKKHRELVAPP
jgi:hypothetical protein